MNFVTIEEFKRANQISSPIKMFKASTGRIKFDLEGDVPMIGTKTLDPSKQMFVSLGELSDGSGKCLVVSNSKMELLGEI